MTTAIASPSHERALLRCVSCFTLGPAGAVYAGEVTERSVMAVGRSPTAAPLGRFLPRLGPVGFGRRGLFRCGTPSEPSRCRPRESGDPYSRGGGYGSLKFTNEV